MCNTGEIIQQAEEYSHKIKWLKERSDYYPEVFIYKEKNRFIPEMEDCYASTKVRIKRKGKWYFVHVIENILLDGIFTEKDLMLNMMDSVHRVQHLYELTGIPGCESLDPCDDSEAERLKIIDRLKTKNKQ